MNMCKHVQASAL